MFATLPDLTPRESHSLWYSSSRGPVPSHHAPNSQISDHGPQSHHQRQRGQVLERSTLHRLAVNEITSLRRRANVANFGSHWLKPPGVPKTLHQMREEKREHDEHQEAMRREQLAQELADAEAAGMPDEDGMDDVQLDGAQDLDDDIPDAGDDFFAANSDEGEDEDDEEEDEEGTDGDDDEHGGDHEAHRRERQVELMAARMRMTDDAFRQIIMLGDPDGDGMYGGEEELEEEGQGHMLDEDDFLQSGGVDGDDDGGMGDMDADLDDEIPEAEEEGGYEHTDSEAELSSSSDNDSDAADGYTGHQDPDDVAGHSMDFGLRASQVMGPPQSPTLRGREDASGLRQSLELSSILSQDDTSFMDSSPAQGRRARQL